MLYLAPQDPAPFRALTRALWAAFPAWPPYGGQFAEVVPHLTVGDRAARSALVEAEGRVQAFGAISGRAHRLTLMVQDRDGRWSCRDRWILGGSRR